MLGDAHGLEVHRHVLGRVSKWAPTQRTYSYRLNKLEVHTYIVATSDGYV